MPHIAVGDRVSTNARRTHRSAEFHVLNKLEFLLSNYIIPPAVVHPLTEQLDWRLSTIFLPARHVQVINENNILHIWRWTKTALFPSVHATINNILSLVSRCLC